MNKFMKEAIKEAQIGIKSGHGGPFGAVIVKDGKIIGRGHNMVIANADPTCHGEIEAIHSACKNLSTYDLSGADIYTTGQPCPMCLGAILWANIDHIYYGCSVAENSVIGFRDEIFYKTISLSTKKLASRLIQVDHDECHKLFDKYLKIKDKQSY